MISKQTGLTWKKDFPKALRSLLFEEPSYFNLTVKISKALPDCILFLSECL
jgi:hypothetical protein